MNTIDAITIPKKKLQEEKNIITALLIKALCKILRYLGAKHAAREVLEYGLPQQIFLHRDLYDMLHHELIFIVPKITPMQHCTPGYIELNWNTPRPDQDCEHIAVVAYDKEDFFLWLEYQDLEIKPNNKNKRIQQIGNTFYHCVTTPDDVNPIFSKVIKLNACTSNKYYNLIMNILKLRNDNCSYNDIRRNS